MNKKACLLFVVILTTVLYAHTVSAHDLIPRALQDYIVAHPQATPEDIKAFADQQAPEYAQKFRDGAQIIAIAQNQNTSPLDTALDFTKLGVTHILSGPDHILFILSLLLVFVSLLTTLKLATLFTVGHSITLFLATAGILTISTRITEPLIALSIAFVAIVPVFFAHKRYINSKYTKPASVFFFSLFHGLGFAGLLKEIQVPPDKFVLSLVSFNIGIEIGQLIIIAAALPFIFLLKDKPYFPRLIRILAVIIAAIAFFWFIQRVFFPS